MKKKFKLFGILLALTLGLSLMVGCGDKESDGPNTFGNTTNGIYLLSDLRLKECILYDFDTKKYDSKEYSELLEQELAEYNKKHVYKDAEGKDTPAIAIEKVDVSKNVLTQILTYYDTADYLEYNKGELQKRSGKTLETGTLAAPNSTILSYTYVDKKGEAVNLEELVSSKEASEYRYVICDLQAVLYGEGKVVAYTTNGTYTEDLNCVTVKGGSPVAVIYRSTEKK